MGSEPVTRLQAQVCSGLDPEDVKVRVLQPQLPTRILDLGLKSEDIIKLVESNDSLIGHYICLSYCWGSKRPLVTTWKNITAWKKQIPWKALPKTFQDAVTFQDDEISDDYTVYFFEDYDFGFPGPDQVKKGQKIQCFTLGAGHSQTVAWGLLCLDETQQLYKRIGLLIEGFKTPMGRLIPDWHSEQIGSRRTVSGDSVTETVLTAFSTGKITSSDEKLPPIIDTNRLVSEESWESLKALFDPGDINFAMPYTRERTLENLIFAKMTPQQATEIGAQEIVSEVVAIFPTQHPENGEWFLTAQNTERKELGERYASEVTGMEGLATDPAPASSASISGAVGSASFRSRSPRSACKQGYMGISTTTTQPEMGKEPGIGFGIR
ncbi:uncharacterized protein PAC_06438 [Phialocephala subalpina]|uniref:Heterokaryon incompatibility domain-containing protein n=1 Tax=Phialocephala subalpina TaxID=576137 RepID=A0A1L7WUU9_9HELO|nr:uncharacterized protein PAC_06438 [Phialocephala subalpina]